MTRSHPAGVPIGLQLYTLHERLDDDLPGTLAEIRHIGFETVELASFHGRSPADFAALLRDAGLRCRSAHIAAQPLGESGSDPTLGDDLDRLGDDLRTVGVKTVVLPAFPIPERLRVGEMTMDAFRAIGLAMTDDDWRVTADFLNEKGAALASRGLRLAYHNHNFEFARMGDATVIEHLLAATDADLVSFEMDVGWVTAAGVAPLELIAAHPGRFRQAHVKDLLAAPPNTRLDQTPADVGAGAIDWPSLLPELRIRGIAEFYVEREPPFTDDPIASVKRSYDYLARI